LILRAISISAHQKINQSKYKSSLFVKDMKKTLNKNTSILAFFVIMILGNCKTEKDPIPNVYVNFEIYLGDAQYNALQTVGNYVYVTGGVSGILLYRKSADEISAFERACPYDPDCGKVTVDNTGITAVDSDCCRSEFILLLDGAVTKGPSQFPLKKYSSQFNINTNTLRVTN
jgi:nitrite reductase/ring-hydroxylating ferredoxin subunit